MLLLLMRVVIVIVLVACVPFGVAVALAGDVVVAVGAVSLANAVVSDVTGFVTVGVGLAVGFAVAVVVRHS